MKTMIVFASRSSAPKESFALVKAAAEFLCYRSMRDDTRDSLRDELVTALKHFWPKLHLYVGNTHFRVFLDGKREGADQVYIEWAETFPPSPGGPGKVKYPEHKPNAEVIE